MTDPIDILENKLMEETPELLGILLTDRTTRKNIFWATDSYADNGEGYRRHDNISVKAITGEHGDVIMPRAMKSHDEQQRRSRQMAEVFTSPEIVKKMNDVIDREFAESQSQQDGDENRWEDYVLTTDLEITCGEAPFLTTRYDAVSGEPIPMDERTGMLDRKLRKVNDHSEDAD